MDMPEALREAIDQAALAFPNAKLKTAVRSMTQRYTLESGKGARYVTEPAEVAAYAAVRMPATFSAVSAALEHTFRLFSGGITSLLDIGTGTGACPWAVREVLGEGLSITCIERETAMAEYARSLMKADETLSHAGWIERDIASSPITEKADLVTASYCLNELAPAPRERVLKALWQAADKLFLLIEPGTMEGYAQISRAREILTGLGGHIVAPCPGNGSCPLPSDDWCHFTARTARSRLHKALKDSAVPYEDEKYSFLAVSKEPCMSARARVLRHPVREPGRITLRLCTQQGIVDRTVTRKDTAFREARKASSGDVFEG